MVILYVDKQDQEGSLSRFIENNQEPNGVMTPTRAMEQKINYWDTSRSAWYVSLFCATVSHNNQSQRLPYVCAGQNFQSGFSLLLINLGFSCGILYGAN